MTTALIATALDWLPRLTIVLAFLAALIRLILLAPLLWRRARRWKHGLRNR
ncbi:hypothetical protein [Micromonospora arida]|uniref:hypothetical protein n=1 Tax=Micromonospora arida TaxID=2203715 RepID=UPI0033A1C765